MTANLTWTKINQLVKYQDRRLNTVYAAISHPVRRSVLQRLRLEGATVTELASHYPMSLVAVSKHIRVLETAGLVRRTVKGREHHLALEPGPLLSAAGWFDEYRTFWNERLDLLDTRIRARKSQP